jgi:hypothetical protein
MQGAVCGPHVHAVAFRLASSQLLPHPFPNPVRESLARSLKSEKDIMKPNQLAALVLRLIGIYCLVQSLNAISLLYSVFMYNPAPPVGSRMMPDESRIIVVTISLLLRLLIGYLLLTRADAWGKRLAPGDEVGPVASAISVDQIQALAFAVVGIMIVADTLPQLSSLALSIGYFPQVYSWRNSLVGAGSLLKVGLGLWMFLGSRSFVNFWLSFRSFGTPKPANPGNERF